MKNTSCNTLRLKPLTGTVKPFHEQVKELKRPYQPITEEQYETLLAGCSDYYETEQGEVVTFGNADGGYALMPLNDKAAQEILDNQPDR